MAEPASLATSLLQKDVRLTRDIAGARGATAPESLVALAEAALAALTEPS